MEWLSIYLRINKVISKATMEPTMMATGNLVPPAVHVLKVNVLETQGGNCFQETDWLYKVANSFPCKKREKWRGRERRNPNLELPQRTLVL